VKEHWWEKAAGMILPIYKNLMLMYQAETTSGKSKVLWDITSMTPDT
jgi:hypothetical protein